MKGLIAVPGLTLLLTHAISAQGTPYITISVPVPGTQIPVSAAGVAICGTGGFRNDLITFQALKATHQVIATTPDSGVLTADRVTLVTSRLVAC